MQIEKVDLRGYGSLRARIFDFGPRINVVSGYNEAGKSTLMRAIEVLLYGHFRDSERWDGATTLFQFEPWAGGPYGGTISLLLASGERYRIDRRFDSERTRIYRDPRGEDVTEEYHPGPHGWVDFVDRHLGLSPSVFRASACIRQNDLVLGKEGVATLRARLEQLSDSGGLEQSAQDALASIDRQLMLEVNPGSVVLERSPLLRARQAVQDLTAQLASNAAALGEVGQLIVQERPLAIRGGDLDQQLVDIGGLIAWHVAEGYAERLTRLAGYAEAIRGGWAALSNYSDVEGLTEENLVEAEAALSEVVRIGRDLERLEHQVELDHPNQLSAEAELSSLSATLASLPTTTESTTTPTPTETASDVDVSNAERAVEAWASASEALRDAEESLVTLRQRRADAEARADRRLARLNPASSLEARSALSNALTRRNDLDAAEVQVEAHPADPAQQAELIILDKSLGDLTSEGVEELRAEAASPATDEPNVPKPRSLSPAPVGIGAIAGLVVGYALGWLLVPGLAIPTVVLVAIVGGFVGFVIDRRPPETDTSIPTTRELLTQKLVVHGVASIVDLQRRWNRRAELREILADARHSLAQHATAQAAHDRAVADLEAATGVRDLDEANDIVLALEAAREQNQTFEGRARQVQETLTLSRLSLEQCLATARSALAVLGMTSDDPSAARTILRGMRNARGTRTELLSRQNDLHRALATYERTIFDRDAYRGAFSHAEEQLAEALYVVGVAPEPATREANLAVKRVRLGQRRELEHQFELQQQSRAAFIGNEDPETWRAQGEIARARAVPPSAGDQRTLDDLLTDQEQLQKELHDAQTELTQLTATREAQSRDLLDQAEIAEHRAQAEETLARLEYLESVWKEASARIDTVGTEYRRAFAPNLAASVSAWIERATNGRYVRAEVSPSDLAVRLDSHERAGLATLDVVSQGTRDAVALLLRTSMVDLLSTNAEPVPIFLDDPLVRVDPERTVHILDVLSEVAQSRQLFYFTQDIRVIEWATGRENCLIHELGPPT